MCNPGECSLRAVGDNENDDIHQKKKREKYRIGVEQHTMHLSASQTGSPDFPFLIYFQMIPRFERSRPFSVVLWVIYNAVHSRCHADLVL